MYDQVPHYCTRCSKFGHLDECCNGGLGEYVEEQRNASLGDVGYVNDKQGNEIDNVRERERSRIRNNQEFMAPRGAKRGGGRAFAGRGGRGEGGRGFSEIGGDRRPGRRGGAVQGGRGMVGTCENARVQDNKYNVLNSYKTKDIVDTIDNNNLSDQFGFKEGDYQENVTNK